MKKIFLGFLSMIIGLQMSSQVGINTDSPSATLDIRGENGSSSPGALTANDGILVPRVNALSVDGTSDGQLIFLDTDKRFYFWDSTADDGDGDWLPLLTGGTNVSDLIVDGAVRKNIKFGDTITDTDYTVVLSGNATLPSSNADNQGRILVICSDGNGRTLTPATGEIIQSSTGTNTDSNPFGLGTFDEQRCITIQAIDNGRWWIISRD